MQNDCMQKQLQHTTIAVIALLVVLGGALYLVETTTNGSESNTLTAATVGAQVVNCDEPPAKDASSLEKQEYYDQCKKA